MCRNAITEEGWLRHLVTERLRDRHWRERREIVGSLELPRDLLSIVGRVLFRMSVFRCKVLMAWIGDEAPLGVHSLVLVVIIRRLLTPKPPLLTSTLFIRRV
jgi:hypothetical protein